MEEPTRWKEDCLKIYSEVPLPHWPWLEESWQKPESFWKALFLPFTGKSSPQQGWALYHDCVERHCQKGRVALGEWQEGQWNWYTYDDLHEKCCTCAQLWLRKGVSPGTRIALLPPMDVQWVVSFWTALYFGAIPLLLPHGGKTQLLSWLESVKADFVAGERLPEVDLPQLPLEGEVERGTPLSAYIFEDSEPFGEVYSPWLGGFYPLLPQYIFPSVLRDSQLILGLTPETMLGSLASFLPSQPYLLLCAFLSGATYLLPPSPKGGAGHRPWQGLSKVLLELDEASADQLIQSGLPQSLEGWFRSPLEGTLWGTWQKLAEISSTQKLFFFHFVADLAVGGGLFFSPRTAHFYHLRLDPVPGLAWHLESLTPFPHPTQQSYGRFSVDRGEVSQDYGGLLLSAQKDGHYYSASLVPHQRGWVVPWEKVEQSLTAKFHLDGAVCFPLPSSERLQSYQWKLLLFVSEELAKEEEEELRQKVLSWLGHHYGTHLFPLTLEVFPFSAPCDEAGNVDRELCLQWYQLGFLHRKRDSSLYQELEKLRRLWKATVFHIKGE